jgi:fermentation-respiration switch protein FrsA (DUF1100 family)
MVALYFGQDLLIYQNNLDYAYEEYPEENQEGKRNPQEKNMSYEDITVNTEDGLKLSGWFIHHDRDTIKHPTIIYMQENYGNIGYRLSWAENIYHNLGANIVIVGYRGYGHSEGDPSEHGVELDAKAIIKWTLNNDKILQNQVYVFGNVLGGAVGVYGASFYQDQLKGIILQNTFLNMANAVDDTNWLFRLLRPLILANYWPTDQRIGNITLPILFISGTDTKTNDDMHQLYDNATSSIYTDFLEVPSGTKKNTWRIGGKSYLLAIDEFILKTRGMIYMPLETDESVDFEAEVSAEASAETSR